QGHLVATRTADSIGRRQSSSTLQPPASAPLCRTTCCVVLIRQTHDVAVFRPQGLDSQPGLAYSEGPTVSRPRRVAALDLGTTKVCCAVADIDLDGIRVLGVGEVASRGVRKAQVIDIERAAEAVAEAVDACERISGVAVDGAVVGISGGHVGSQN